MAFSDAQLQNLKVMLELQADAYKNSLMMVHNDVKELRKNNETEIQDLRKFLDYSQKQIEEMENKLKTLESREQKFKQQEEVIMALKNQVNNQENYSRRNNIWIDGVEELPNENYEQTQRKVDKLIRDKLKLNSVKVEVVHRVPSRSSNSFPPLKPRTIIARLMNFNDHNNILKNSKNLKKKWSLDQWGPLWSYNSS